MVNKNVRYELKQSIRPWRKRRWVVLAIHTSNGEPLMISDTVYKDKRDAIQLIETMTGIV